jgi:hypothetical protein
MRARTILLLLVCLVATPALADSKYGRQVRFAGVHPIPKSEGGGMCYIEGPHVHIYTANKLEYRTHGDDHVFVGDPVAYGYDGPKYAYKGPHPVQVEAVVGGDPAVDYCYITGPHYHYFAPPEGPDFKVVGDAYFYVGQPPQAFIEARPTYIGINDYYRPIVYTRPVVEVAPPEGWIGVRAEFMGPAVVVGGPGVVVERPAIVAPAVVVTPPSVHVGVGVNVGVGVGGGVIVHDRPVIIERRGRENDQGEDHDRGRHEGWHKGRH